MITPSQIRAARAILNWSQRKLAKITGLSIATIRKIELAYISPRNSTLSIICQAFEAAGIEFIDPDGARRRSVGVAVFEGAVGGHAFMEDLHNVVRKGATEVLILAPDTQSFASYCGLESILKLDCLIDSNNVAEIKCLLTDEIDPPLSTPRFQFRTISRNFVDPVPFCAYGQKYGMAVPNGEPFCKMIVVESPKMFAAAKRHFLSLWDKATPALTEIQPKKNAANSR